MTNITSLKEAGDIYNTVISSKEEWVDRLLNSGIKQYFGHLWELLPYQACAIGVALPYIAYVEQSSNDFYHILYSSLKYDIYYSRMSQDEFVKYLSNIIYLNDCLKYSFEKIADMIKNNQIPSYPTDTLVSEDIHLP